MCSTGGREKSSAGEEVPGRDREAEAGDWGAKGPTTTTPGLGRSHRFIVEKNMNRSYSKCILGKSYFWIKNAFLKENTYPVFSNNRFLLKILLICVQCKLIKLVNVF